ncbi:MAG TPA: GYF domain-containing protein [Pyrinomonadaceae bacterium]|nr:GYF domain-containing protein [Pyrinomonadaceae bacterium]
MPIYINKNNQQSGPYEEHVVIDQLRSGMLSPNDLGIRHGETTWQRLGDLFPQVGSTPTPPPVSGTAPAAHFASPGHTPKSMGVGCRKPLGWTIFAVGLLTMLLGALVAIATPFIYTTPSCDFADSDKAEVEKLMKEYEKVKGTSEEFGKKVELDSAMAGYETSNDHCGEALEVKRWYQVGSIAVAIFGFVMLITGFFIRRV